MQKYQTFAYCIVQLHNFMSQNSKYSVMKKGLIFLIVLFFEVTVSYSGNVDSLKSLLNSTKGVQRASVLIELSNATVYNATADALVFAGEAFEIASQAKNDSLKYAALKAMGYANGYLGHFEVSLQNMKDGLSHYEQINDSVNMAKAMSDIAYLLQAMSSSEANIMEYNQKALSIREKIGDEKGVAYSLNNIGALYWQWGKHDQAVEYFIKALPYFEQLQLDEEVATANGNIGAYYTETGEYDKAKWYIDRSLNVYRALNHKLGESQALSNLGKIALKKRQFNLALAYNDSSMLIREALGDREGLIANYFNIGHISLLLGETPKAEHYLTKSMATATEIGQLHKLIMIHLELSELYKQQNNFKGAYEHLLQSKILNDSIFSVEKHRQLEEIKTKYDVERKEAENLRLQIENENNARTLRKNKMLFLLIFLAFCFLGIILYLILQRKRAEEKLRSITNEQRLLRTQMNPHFIFNAIAAIQNYIIGHTPKDAINYLSKFAALMRQILESSKKEFIDLESEIQLLKNYITLQQLRYSNKFDFSISIDPRINHDETLIPPMLNQPFIENSIEHGFKDIGWKGLINVSYLLKDDQLLVEIEDDGIGFKRANNKKTDNHLSFATQTIKNRLQMINKKNRKKLLFEMIDKSDQEVGGRGTIVRFNLPYMKTF